MDKLYPYIEWQRLGIVMNYHIVHHQCELIDVPWIVPENVKSVTFTEHDKYVLKDGSCLIGSGEQGFIDLTIDGGHLMPRLWYITCTPCFRNEKNISAERRNYFMKSEIFRLLRENDNVDVTLKFLISMAEKGFRAAVPGSLNETFIYRMKTDEGFDLMIDDVEIGSYYFREFKYNNKKYRYVCGTAIAEPRFSYAIDKILSHKCYYNILK